MQANMMTEGLLISDILEHAARYHGNTEIVTRKVEGDIHRYTYRDALQRSKQLANALIQLGVREGDRIATLAWNTHRHFEIYYAVSGMGAITHTINPRLFSEQILYIIDHADDQYIFVDLSFVPILESLKGRMPKVKGIVVMTEATHMPDTTLDNILCYETMVENASPDYQWPRLDQETAAALCYTSGTTGNPKGVLYSHRSTVMHAYASCLPDALNLSSDTTVLPVVPMFHVCAWGTPYSGPLSGSKLILPGAGMDGASLSELIHQEQATLLLGVPTVWLALLNHLEQANETLESVEKVVIGGSAAPLSMIQAFQEQHDAFVLHAWGMTEMSPLGTIGSMTSAMRQLPLQKRYKIQQKQGRPIFGVHLKIVDDNGKRLPEDGQAYGRLMVKGPWVIEHYFKQDQSALENGWFDTGDVATLDPDGYMQIVDRRKDVIKSGGEWISSIELENAAVGHPEVAEACVIGVKHEKWDERPLLLVVKTAESQLDKSGILEYLQQHVAKWWLPDDVIFVDELPHTATGKLLKTNLREQYREYLAQS